MSEDLKIIKKLYGEKMMHFCRESFSTILEEIGKLPRILQDNFAPSHNLYNDLIKEKKIEVFKNYIYDNFNEKDEKIEIIDVQTPKELMRQAGYILYECKTESDIQSFKKYYAKGEDLCTFNGGRLKFCYVFFAVKEDVDEIKRKDFKKPERQDKYGTSVISIQFSRDRFHTLSIKNRYNHRVENPDATFSNNLDNIIEGLTKSFEETYGFKQKYKNDEFELPRYVRADDGKWYKYNLEISNIYYCPDNIIINNGEVLRYTKEKYIIMDYFILDLTHKIIILYDNCIPESFPNIIGRINKIAVEKKGEEKEITIVTENNEEIIITIDKSNQIVGFKSENIKMIGDYFLCNNKALKSIDIPNLQMIGNMFLYSNQSLTSLNLPSLKIVKNSFLAYNETLTELELPSLQKVGNDFLWCNMVLANVRLPMLQEVGSKFLYSNEELITLELPELQKALYSFMTCNQILEIFEAPMLQEIGYSFLYSNKALMTLALPNLQQVGDSFLYCNDSLKHLSLPKLQQAGDNFLVINSSLITLDVSALQQVGSGFLYNNKKASVGLLRFIQMRIRYEYLNIMKKYVNIQADEKDQGRK